MAGSNTHSGKPMVRAAITAPAAQAATKQTDSDAPARRKINEEFDALLRRYYARRRSDIITNDDVKTNANKPFGTNGSISYSTSVVEPIKTALAGGSPELSREPPSPEQVAAATLAARFGLSPDKVILAVAQRAAEEATQHADADSILRILTWPQIVAVVEDSTVGKLYRRYHVLLREMVLPAEGKFTRKDQADQSARLSSTYMELIRHQAALGIKPSKKDSLVTQADTMRTAFVRALKKIKAARMPTKPLSSPATVSQPPSQPVI